MYSSNGTLESLKGVWFLTKAYQSIAFFFFFLLLKSLYGARVGKVWGHTIIAYFAKSNNGSEKKDDVQLNQDVHMCRTLGGYIVWLT